MSARILFVLSLALVPLSGCLAGVGSMSAQAGFDTASTHITDVLELEGEPVFMGVASIEPFKHYLEEGESYEFEMNTYADPVQGDGKVPGWAYAYCVGEDLVVVFLASGVGVLADAREGGDCDQETVDAFAIHDWEVDSDEAAQTLAEHPDWPAATEEAITFWILTMPFDYYYDDVMAEDEWEEEDGAEAETAESEAEPRHPVWMVEMETYDASYSATVDATTGEVIEVDEYRYDDVPPEVESTEVAVVEVQEAEDCRLVVLDSDDDSGSLMTLLGSEESYEFGVFNDGYIYYSVQTSNQVGVVTVDVYDGEGDRLKSDSRSSIGGGGTVDGQLEGLPHDDYTLVIEADGAADYHVTYEYGYYDC